MKIYQWDKIYGWAGGVKIKINDHLSPAEAEIRAELGKTNVQSKLPSYI